MSKSLQDSINWVQPSIGYKNPAIGNANEPAIGAGNMTKQVMQSPPFKTNWNRAVVSFFTVPYQQDYPLASMSNFGFLEKATFQPAASVTAVSAAGGFWAYQAVNTFVQGQLVTVTGLATEGSPPFSFNVTNAVLTSVTPTSFTIAGSGTVSQILDSGLATSGKITEFSKVLNHVALGLSSDFQQPTTISAQLNDLVNAVVTFRLLGVPKQVYNIVVTYQMAPTLFVSLASLWAPIPDYLQNIFNLGFRAYLYEAMGDARAQGAKLQFAAAMLSNNEGLSETEINMFLVQHLGSMAQTAAAQLGLQQGIQANGSR